MEILSLLLFYVSFYFSVVPLPNCDFSTIQIQGTLINVLCKLLILLKHYGEGLRCVQIVELHKG